MSTFETQNEIRAIADRLTGKVPNIQQLAQRAIEGGNSVSEFRARAMEMLPEVQPLRSAPLSVPQRDWKHYSLSRALGLIAENKPLDGLEAELSSEIARNSKTRPSGFFVPDEAMVRSHVAGTGTLGGFIVEQQNLGEQFIPMLRNRARVLGLGARTLNLTNPVTIPRQSGACTANWVGETVASTLSAMDFQQLTLTPKACSAFQQYSKQLLLTGNPSIDSLIRDDINQQIALAIDSAVLGSGGGSVPVGLAATTGINTITFAANGLTLGNTSAYPMLVSMETEISNDNADVETMGYLMRAGHRGALKTQQRFSGSDEAVFQTVRSADGSTAGVCNGYRVAVSQQIATNLTTGTATTLCSAIYFGDWNQCLIASFGATDLVVDPYVLAVNGVVRVIARRWIDVGFRQPSAFCITGGILTN